MIMDTTFAITHHERTIETPYGNLYAKGWNFQNDSAERNVPIILFHDSLGCVALWRDFPQNLAIATGRDVIAYDRLGFGASDPHPGCLANDFIHAEANGGFQYLRDALGIQDFMALGHSVGGGMAVGCAAQFPDQCQALITESAQAFVEDRTIDGIREAKRMFTQPGQLQRLEKYHGDKAAWVLSSWIDSWLAPEFADWSLERDLRQVVCPVLAIHGELDEYGSAAHLDRIVSTVRGASTRLMLSGVSHVPHREQQTKVIDLVDRWLRSHA
jgi:pimeloyl-ACP methyl ester carboxylesterase